MIEILISQANLLIIIFVHFAESSVLISRIRADLLSSVEEAKRDAQPDVQALANSVYKILISN